MNERTSKLLLDAYHACGDIMAYVDGVSLQDYTSSKMIRDAVERNFLVVAEAISKAMAIDGQILGGLPEYRRLRGMRNRLVHDYERTDNKVVWAASKRYVPVLRERLRGLLTDESWGYALNDTDFEST